VGVERNVISVVYTAVEPFNHGTRRPARGVRLRTGEVPTLDWPTFIAQSRLTHLREVVSLDGILCPNVFQELIAEDWEHNVHEDLGTHLFHDLDHVCVRVAGRAANVLALIEEPSVAEVASYRDPRFEFCGFDLVDERGGISALTNCGGFDKAFAPGDLSECGLLVDHAKAVAVRQLLRTEYPDEPHARCHVWAIWRMRT
jgi:hypothetical protein